MADPPQDRPRSQWEGDPLPSRVALLAAIREVAERQGRNLAELSRDAGLEDLLVRVEADKASPGAVSMADVAVLGGLLRVSASELIARAEVLEREQPEIREGLSRLRETLAERDARRLRRPWWLRWRR